MAERGSFQKFKNRVALAAGAVALSYGLSGSAYAPITIAPSELDQAITQQAHDESEIVIGRPDDVDASASDTYGGWPLHLGDDMFIAQYHQCNGGQCAICTTTWKQKTEFDLAAHCADVAPAGQLYMPFPVDPMDGGNWSASVNIYTADSKDPVESIPVEALAMNQGYFKYSLGKVSGQDMMAIRTNREPVETSGFQVLPTLPITMVDQIGIGTVVHFQGFGGSPFTFPREISMTIDSFLGSNPTLASLMRMKPGVDANGDEMYTVSGDSGGPFYVEGEDGKKYQIARLSGGYPSGEFARYALASSAISNANREIDQEVNYALAETTPIPSPMHYLFARNTNGLESAGYPDSSFDGSTIMEAYPTGATAYMDIMYLHKNPDMVLKDMHLVVGVQAPACVIVADPTTLETLQIENIKRTLKMQPRDEFPIVDISMDIIPRDTFIDNPLLAIATLALTDTCPAGSMNEIHVYPVGGGTDPLDEDEFQPTSVTLGYHEEGDTKEHTYHVNLADVNPAEGVIFLEPIHVEGYPGMYQTITTSDGQIALIRTLQTDQNPCTPYKFIVDVAPPASDPYDPMLFDIVYGYNQHAFAATPAIVYPSSGHSQIEATPQCFEVHVSDVRNGS